MRISLNRLKKTRSRGIKYRQLLAVLLCICMGLTICPDIQAAQRDTVNPRLPSDHSHAVCGDKSGCTLCSDGEHSQITYTAVNNAEEFVQAAKDGGNYYLADDIEIIGGGDEIYGTSKAVVNIENDFNLCMNGHTCSIKIVSDKGTSYYAMLLKGAANFNLCDCSEGKTGKLINNSFEEGKGTQNAPHVIYSEGSGDITMYGGTVSNNNNSWVLNCMRSTGKQIVDGAVFEGSYVLSGKKIIVKSGTVGSSGGAGNVISSANITVEGGTVNGFVQLNSSGEGKFTGGVVNGYLSLGSNSVSEVGNITINALRNQYLGGINAANSSNVKVYLYDSPTFTGMAKNREIYYKASDTAEGATIIPHSRDNSKNYTGTGIITLLLSSSSAKLGQYVMQDLPSADYLKKFKLSTTVDFVLRLADKDKNLKLDRIININTTNFPDDSFRKFVSESYDDDNDGKLYESDVSTVETMDIRNKGIRNLKGIEYFTGITSLNCSKNQLAALDLSKNTKLNTLNASDNVVSIGFCTEYDLTALPGMDTEKVSSVNGAALSDGKLTEFTGTGKITYTYDVGNSGVDNPQFSLKYDEQEHQHQYGKWILTKEPTETAEGTAERTCSECKEKEIKNNVPNLKDPIWQKGDYVAPTRDDEGSQSYTSTEYGTVKVVIPALGITEEEKVAEAKKVVEEALAGMTVTNNTTREDIQSVIDSALTEAGISSEDVTVTVGNVDKTDATTSEDGKIGGSVSIVSKKDESVKDSVPVNKTITKLPKTEEEKVAEAKKVVEEALAGMTVTNNTTREDIQSVIDSALTEAGISSEDVTVTVGNVDKTDATTSEDGKIGGSVSIVSKKDESVKDSVLINKIITRLSGNISKDVEKGENAPDTVLVSSEKELADILLTAEEKELVGNAIDIKFVLNVKNAENTVSSGDKEAVQSALNGYEKGQYLDIALFKVVGQNRSTISETAKRITITLAIPDRLKNTDGRKTRKYAVIRVHNGIADILTDMDDNDDTVTIMTDRFSAYAIVYKDEGGNVNDNNDNNNNNNSNNSNAGDNNGNTAGNADNGGSNKTGDNNNTGASSLTEREKQEKRELVLNGKLKASQTGSQINITWGKVSGADGYDVYVQYCGMKFNAKSLYQIKSGKNVKITVKKVNGKKLNLKKNYKIYIRAYKLSGGKKKTLAKTIIAHIVGKNNKKYTNVKAIKIKKSSYSLKVGKIAKIKAKTVLVNKNKKQLSNAHAKQFRYATSNKKVAEVSKKGKIKAVGTGSCIIYVYARNGYAKKVKVTVSD